MTSGFMRTGQCQVCGSPDRAFLLTVPHLGEFPALCTACVLRHKADSFCAVCFDVYDYDDTSPPAKSRTMCLRCIASAHNSCLPSVPPFPAFMSYICPQCLDPSFSFISVHPRAAVTRDLGKLKQLLCAAKISAAFLQTAAAVSREDEYQKSIAALEATGNAKNAIDRVAFFTSYLQSQEEIVVDENDVDDGNAKEDDARTFLMSNQQNQHENHLDDDETAVNESLFDVQSTESG